MPGDPLAFITIRGYGTWLHGDERGSMDPEHNAYESPPIPSDVQLENIRASRPKRAAHVRPATAGSDPRGIEATCEHRGWPVVALNVRTNHVHIIVEAPDTPERVMNVLKSWATREMVARGVLPRVSKPGPVTAARGICGLNKTWVPRTTT